MNPLRLRKMTWAIVVFSVLMLIWAVASGALWLARYAMAAVLLLLAVGLESAYGSALAFVAGAATDAALRDPA